MTSLSEAELAAGLDVAQRLRVAVFVVAYNAEAHIQAVLRRIPASLRPLLAAIYVIDDKSSDRTTPVARAIEEEIPGLEVFTTPFNQGYGGNQKLGYQYAIERGFDVVVLLHGDGQYAPEVMPRLLAPFQDAATSAVFGSRMLVKGAARRGGMPFYKRIGNRVLTSLQNRLLGTRLSEFHSGYRAYRVAALADIPFRHNANGFHFDTEVILQLLGKGHRIVEVPIPTYYGDEICHVNGIGYAARCLMSVLRYRANRLHLVYHPKFDLEGADARYEFKRAPNSVHQFVVRRALPAQTRVLELGAGAGDVSLALHDKGSRIVAMDLRRPAREFSFPYLEHDLDGDFAAEALHELGGPADLVLALDVIEHMSRPEHTLREIGRVLAPGRTLIASTGNVAYIVLRVALLLGQFNYGKKGILDLTHRRLFTIRSFRRTIEGAGFRVDKVRGFGPPIRDMVGDSLFLRGLDRVTGWLARLWPSLCSYQFVVEATRLDDVDDLLRRTLASRRPCPAPAAGA